MPNNYQSPCGRLAASPWGAVLLGKLCSTSVFRESSRAPSVRFIEPGSPRILVYLPFEDSRRPHPPAPAGVVVYLPRTALATRVDPPPGDSYIPCR